MGSEGCRRQKYARTTVFAAPGLAVALSLTVCGGDASGKGSPSSGPSPPHHVCLRLPFLPAFGLLEEHLVLGRRFFGQGRLEGREREVGLRRQSGRCRRRRHGPGGKNLAFRKTRNLVITAENVSPDASTGAIDITVINRGNAACSVTGFAGIGLTDEDTTTNPIDRGKVEPRITDLQPGGAAVFNLLYEIGNSGNSLTHPTEIQVTPPNQTSHVNVKWSAGANDIKGSYADVKVYPTHNK